MAKKNNDNGNIKKSYKEVCEVFNDLTKKSDELFNEINGFPIDTVEEIKGIINWIFDRALKEPNLSIVYALICRKLILAFPLKRTVNIQCITFRKILVARCLEEFETNNSKVNDGRIKTCSDSKAKLKENIPFIVELCKQQMLSMKVTRIVENRLKNNIEDELEFLTALLTITGEELESATVDLDPTFAIIKDFVHKTLSNDVRLKLTKLIDLRAANWIAPTQVPLPIDELKNDNDIIQVLNSARIQRKINIDKMSNCAVTIVATPSNKLKVKQPAKTTDLLDSSSILRQEEFNSTLTTTMKNDRVDKRNDNKGSGATSQGKNITSSIQSHATAENGQSAFIELSGSCVPDSNIKRTNSTSSTNTADISTALERENKDTGLRPDNKDPHNNIAESQYRSIENSSMPLHQVPVVKQQQTPIEQPQSKLSNQLEMQIRIIVLEYLAGCSDINETNKNIKASLPPPALKQLVSDTYNYLMDKPTLLRSKTGELFAELIIRETLSITTFSVVLKEVLSRSQNVKVSNPNYWNNYAELIAPLVIGRVLQLTRFHKCCDQLISLGYAHNLLASLFKIILEKKGPNFLLSIWNSSNMSFQDFMNPEQNFQCLSEQQQNSAKTTQAIMMGSYNMPSSFSELHYSAEKPATTYLQENYPVITTRNQIAYWSSQPQNTHYYNHINMQGHVPQPTQVPQPVQFQNLQQYIPQTQTMNDPPSRLTQNITVNKNTIQRNIKPYGGLYTGAQASTPNSSAQLHPIQQNLTQTSHLNTLPSLQVPQQNKTMTTNTKRQFTQFIHPVTERERDVHSDDRSRYLYKDSTSSGSEEE